MYAGWSGFSENNTDFRFKREKRGRKEGGFFRKESGPCQCALGDQYAGGLRADSVFVAPPMWTPVR